MRELYQKWNGLFWATDDRAPWQCRGRHRQESALPQCRRRRHPRRHRDRHGHRHPRSTSEICVLRGDVVDHPKYKGRKIFSAGINLTHLYRGKIPFLWYIRRDMGVVNKMLRGIALGGTSPDEMSGGTHEKPWIAGVDV